ncbi:MAG: sigma-70 family RNA polymerase sigma factor, partial [Bacilli bacterium]|nr:sigma-70 family RNA polymerase sigma factor [Bacilli bacterium]
SKDIIKMRYYDDLTQTEVANALGINQVQVSRKEQKILQKLKNKLSA